MALAETATSRTRWNLWLPAVAAAASASMILLAATGTHALKERRTLAVEGRVFGVAHRIEMDLRDDGVDAAPGILQRHLAGASGDVLALTLLAPNGDEQAAAGNRSRETVTREVDLFVGRGGGRGRGGRWGGTERGRWRGGGRFVLQVHLAPRAAQAPLVARLLLPVTAVFAAGLFGLAVLGGRLLTRQRLEAQRSAARRRLEALGRAGAGLAHQLRTPLATIKGACQLMSEEVEGAEQRESEDGANPLQGRLDTVLAQVERMQLMVTRLLDYARPPAPEPSDVEVGDTAREVLGSPPDAPPGLRVRVDPEHFREILEILVDNARKASPPDAPIEVSAAARGSQAVVFVRDAGPGPGDDAERLFEPYVTGRSGGTGLGLPIARTLAEANDGSLVLAERTAGGCEAVLTLPRSDAA